MWEDLGWKRNEKRILCCHSIGLSFRSSILSLKGRGTRREKQTRNQFKMWNNKINKEEELTKRKRKKDNIKLDWDAGGTGNFVESDDNADDKGNKWISTREKWDKTKYCNSPGEMILQMRNEKWQFRTIEKRYLVRETCEGCNEQFLKWVESRMRWLSEK
jgi:hypothetical protein